MHNDNKTKKPGLVYRIFKTYLRFVHDKIYYKRTYAVNKQAIPSNGTPVLIVSNHQNCLNDPLGILFSFSDRKANFITRADVFALSPLANKFLRSIGLLPAFRLQYDGEATLSNNDATFKVSEEALLHGATVVMFPEAGHQDKHWLGSFSLGYTKLAFEAAEMGDFKTEIFILPSCNHYSDYFGIQNRFMVKFGTPISIAPYYELYKTKPRTAQREVNKLVREQIENLMLNINDLIYYKDIYWLCKNYGEEYAATKGIAPTNLPEMLLVQKEIVNKLQEVKLKNEDDVADIYNSVKEMRAIIKQYGISYRNVTNPPTKIVTALKTILLLALLPLFIFSLWPSLFVYGVAMILYKQKSKDPMFEGTFLYAISVLLTIPLSVLLTFTLGWYYLGLLAAIIYTLCIPAIMLFAWKYKEWVKSILQAYNYLNGGEQVKSLTELKESISERMKRIITQNK